MRQCKLEPWDEESRIKFEELRRQAVERNNASQYDTNGTRETWHIVRLFAANGEPHFSLQKRLYTKREDCKKTIVKDKELVKEVQDLRAQGVSVCKISRMKQISCYYVNKLLNTNIKDV